MVVIFSPPSVSYPVWGVGADHLGEAGTSISTIIMEYHQIPTRHNKHAPKSIHLHITTPRGTADITKSGPAPPAPVKLHHRTTTTETLTVEEYK